MITELTSVYVSPETSSPPSSVFSRSPPTARPVLPPMARRLLSRGRLIKLDRPILPAALTRLLSRGPPTPTTSEPEDKGKKAAAAAAVLVEAVATNHNTDAEVGRDGSEEDDEDTSPPWRRWRPDVAWLSKALEPALDLYKQYSWKPFACSSPALQLLLYSILTPTSPHHCHPSI